MMTSRTPGVDPGVKIRGGLAILMRQQFFDGIETTQLGIEHDLCTLGRVLHGSVPDTF